MNDYTKAEDLARDLLMTYPKEELADRVLTQSKALSAVNKHGDYQTLMRRNTELMEALRPFAEAAKSEVVQWGLKYSTDGCDPELHISKDGRYHMIPTSAFAKALEVRERYSQTYTSETTQEPKP